MYTDHIHEFWLVGGKDLFFPIDYSFFLIEHTLLMVKGSREDDGLFALDG